MRKIILIVGAALLVYLIPAWFAGSLFGLHGMKIWILRLGLVLIGMIAAAVAVWFLSSKKKQEGAAAAEPAPAGSEEMALLLRDAEKKLSGAKLEKGARIGNLPAVIVLGETSSTKTSIILQSGLDPELLAGQVYQDGNVTATRLANLWYSRRTVFVEAGGKLLEDAGSRNYLIKRLQPRKAVVGSGGQAPRVALVCVEAERITGSAQTMTAAAVNLRAKLGEISQAFGINLPVYLLFTKSDRLPFFADFVRNLNNEEATQVLGVTLPLGGPTGGVYVEEQTARLGNSFDQLFHSLCDARPEVLSRENEAPRLPNTYEFPREFRKLRGQMLQFLVDLTRPSQLTVGPFLRGFYFTGVRPVVIQEAVAAPSRAPEARPAQSAREATAMFRVPAGGQAAAAAPQQRVSVSRKVPQWLFLSHFFNDVLLADRVAMGASGASTKTNTLRRVLLATAAALSLIFCIGFTVSFFLNRGLESQIKEAVSSTAVAPTGTNLASVDSLRNLDTLRQSLATLTEYYREGAPLRYRWGLYVGNDLYPDVRRLYFSRFKQLLFGQTQNTLVTYMNGLPTAPSPNAPFDLTYDRLKAHLITTSHHDKSTRDWLSPMLLKTWNASGAADPERVQLARNQFDFYSDELKTENPFSNQSDPTGVPTARRYLNQFAEVDRVYQQLKAGVQKPSINFNRLIPGSKDYVVDNYDVAGPFTKDGYDIMSDAIRNPNKLVHGEEWVLGKEGAADSDHSKLIQQLQDRYRTDYIKEWRAYLKSAAVVRYKDIKDAAEKLNGFSSNSSPLLALFALASTNTNVNDAAVKTAFQPVQTVVPPADVRLVGPQNQDYISALLKLQSSVDALAKSPDPNGDPTAALNDATAARQTTKQLANLKFNPDPEAHIDGTTQKLLEDPIANLESLLRGLGPAELNAKGKEFCGQYAAVLRKYPFNPSATTDATVDEFSNVFRKPDGLLWKFYDGSLKKYLVKQGSQYAPVAGTAATLTPRFVDFFNQAAAFSDALYVGGPDPKFAYSLKAVPTEGVQKMGVEIDGQKMDFSGGTPTPKSFTWQGSGAHAARGTFGSEGASFSDNSGTWAIFRLFAEADKRDPIPGGGERLDWVVRTGASRKPSILPSGNPLTVRLELNMAGSPSVFQKGFFSRLACVAEVAKP
ncbi:MAG: ImcF-related family protein [Bryobacteraceae bacterium]